MTGSSHAVFLSYTSEDADAAQRIAEALRAAGIEVWFDKNALRGGDAWLERALGGGMKPCRECQHEISEQALMCPQCGAPYPARESWDGWGYEYKSPLTIAGLHTFHSNTDRTEGQLWLAALSLLASLAGVVCIAQFGIGVVSISQFTVAAFAIAQFAVAYSLIAQFGLYLAEGHGQLVFNLAKLLKVL